MMVKCFAILQLWELWWRMNKKTLSNWATEYTSKTNKKHLNVFQQRKKKGGKIMENDMILTDLEQDKIVPYKHKVHPS